MRTADGDEDGSAARENRQAPVRPGPAALLLSVSPSGGGGGGDSGTGNALLSSAICDEVEWDEGRWR